ncbi:MAG: choice-of-anchor J domain-containing protein [Bacteroidetes bacterium]|nr:choice-of-anchor J domain-containing protein [Bacteroidota bacterium]
MYKKLPIVFIAIFVLTITFSRLYSQIQHTSRYDFAITQNQHKLLEHHKVILKLNENQLKEREYHANYTPQAGETMYAGFSIKTQLDINNSGSWEILGENHFVWRIMIESPDANAIGVIFNNFNLSETAAINIYNRNASHYIGEFNYKNNNDFNILSCQLIAGDAIIIEFIEKAEDISNISSSFTITEIIHITEAGIDIFKEKNLGNSGPCQVNINCEEGTIWQNQKRGVARMLMRVGSSYYWCTGSLVNNTLQDGTPYFLTAAHCGKNATPEDMGLWQFYFNFERPVCDNIGNPDFKVLYGCLLMSQGPMLFGSDFKLLKLIQSPPPSYNVYFNGWNRLDIPSNSGVTIHHPAGDAKKISTYTQTLISASPVISGQQMADNAAWRVTWSQTENGWGVTQGGSSGSPIFDSNGFIIGTLSGGASGCSTPSFPDFYGKMSHHWDKNGMICSERLSCFLDPNNTEVTELQGWDPNFENYPPPGFVKADFISENQVELKWMKPGQIPNREGWHVYSETYTNVSWSGPERATVFDASVLGFSYPAKVTHLSHLFSELPSNPWLGNTFRFKIYDHTGYYLVYQSPILLADKLNEVIHEMIYPITFNNKFYVCVQPIHSSGHPSSAMNMVNLGNGLSFYGNNESWKPEGNEYNQGVYITGIYVEGSQFKHQEILFEKSKVLDSTTVLSASQGYAPINWKNTPLFYKLYKNDVMSYLFNVSENPQLSYVFSVDTEANEYDVFYITAVYHGDVESQASNKVLLFYGDFCEETISNFPYFEAFETTDLPECWHTEPLNSWFALDYYQSGNIAVMPENGRYFIYTEIPNENNEIGNWLVTPKIDITEINKPALKFSYILEDNQLEKNNVNLEVYISKNNNSFVKYWDYSSYSEHLNLKISEWNNVIIDLGLFNGEVIKIAFVFNGQEGAYATIDMIEIFEAANDTYKLSLALFPSNSGEVYGFGQYIAGEKVFVEAYPNVGYRFLEWRNLSDSIHNSSKYEFIMPEENYELTAVFKPYDPVSINEYNESEIRVFPNPSDGIITISFPDNISNARIKIVSSTGVIVAEFLKDATQSLIVRDINNYPLTPGLYFIIIETDAEVRVVKWVKIG